MKPWHLLITVTALLIFLFFGYRDELANIAWKKLHRADFAIALIESDAALARLIGDYHFGLGTYDLARAERAYRKAVAADPKILWGHYQLARIYFLKNDYPRALAEINEELAKNPENLRSLYVRGLIWGFHGDLAKAAEDFSRFTQWAPKEWAGYNDLAWVLAEQGKYPQVKETIKTAFLNVKDAEKNPWLWNSLGVAHLNLKEYREAKNAFVHAKEYAETLTEAEWQKSYPGNNPGSATSGLRAFHTAVEENLTRSIRVENRL